MDGAGYTEAPMTTTLDTTDRAAIEAAIRTATTDAASAPTWRPEYPAHVPASVADRCVALARRMADGVRDRFSLDDDAHARVWRLVQATQGTLPSGRPWPMSTMIPDVAGISVACFAAGV